MSYQLEREMQDRVTRYRNEAAVQRAVSRREFRKRVATGLRLLADRIEERAAGKRPAELTTVVFQGRNR